MARRDCCTSHRVGTILMKSGRWNCVRGVRLFAMYPRSTISYGPESWRERHPKVSVSSRHRTKEERVINEYLVGNIKRSLAAAHTNNDPIHNFNTILTKRRLPICATGRLRNSLTCVFVCWAHCFLVAPNLFLAHAFNGAEYSPPVFRWVRR